jgi:hypothetical protein
VTVKAHLRQPHDGPKCQPQSSASENVYLGLHAMAQVRVGRANFQPGHWALVDIVAAADLDVPAGVGADFQVPTG